MFFCNKAKRKHRSKQQVLHSTKKEQFKTSIARHAEADTDVCNQILYKMQNVTDETIYLSQYL